MAWLSAYLLITVVLVVAEGIDEKPTRRYAEKKFARDGINVRLKHNVERVEDVRTIPSFLL